MTYNILKKTHMALLRKKFADALHAEGLVEVDIPGSIGLLNTLPLQKDFPVAEQYIEQFIKIPIWTFSDESNIVDKYIAGFKKVCDYILENKGL